MDRRFFAERHSTDTNVVRKRGLLVKSSLCVNVASLTQPCGRKQDQGKKKHYIKYREISSHADITWKMAISQVGTINTTYEHVMEQSAMTCSLLGIASKIRSSH